MRKLALLLALASVLVLAGQPASAQFSLGGIRNTLIQWVLDKISVQDVFEITVEDVQGTDEGTRLVGLQIADAEGVWFTAETLSFDFNRSRLLRGQLFIENLSLGDVEVFRQPVIPPGEEIQVNLEGVEQPPEPEFYWPRSPVTAAIQNMVLDNVHLHEGVLGSDITFDATGSFRDQDDVQAAELELRRTDEVEGAIDLDYSRNFAENTLALNLEAAEAPGGLVSELAGLPPQVPVRVAAQAQGTPDDFDATFDLALTDYLQAQGTATLDYAGPLSVDAQFTARPGPLMPEEYAELLGDEAELVVQASEGPDQTVQIETARITSPYLTATVGGTYSRATGEVDAEVQLVAEPGLATPLEDVEFAGLRFEGRVAGQLGSLTADGDLVLEGFASPQVAADRAVLEIDVAQSGPAEAPTTTLTAEGRTEGLRLDEIGPDVIGEANLRLAATMTGDEIVLRTAAIDSQPLDISATGTANIATGDFDVSYIAAAPELGPVLGAYGVLGEGAIEATGQAVRQAGVLRLTTNADLAGFEADILRADVLHLEGNVVQSGDRTTFDLTGNGEGLGVGDLGPDLVGRADLAVTGTIEGDTLTLESARLASAVLDAVVEGQTNTGFDTGQFDFQVSSQNVEPIAAAFNAQQAGALDATGTVRLTADGMALSTVAEFTDLAGVVDAERLQLQATVEQAGERTAFSMTGISPELSVELGDAELTGPVEIAVQGAVEGESLTLSTARIESPILRATATGTVDLARMTGDLSYDVREAQLGALAPLLGIQASGVMTAEGALGVTPEQPDVPVLEGTAAIEDLTLTGIEIGDLVATYDLGLAEAPMGTLQLVLTDSPFAPEDAPTTFDLSMQGAPGDWTVQFDLSAPDYLQAEGEAMVAWQDRLSVSARATARAGPALPEEYAQLLGDEAELVVEARQGADQTVQIEAARLSSPVLNATVDGTYTLDTGVMNLDVQLVAEPELAAPFEGVDFAGLRFDGEVRGAVGSLTAAGDLALDGFRSDTLSVDSAALDINVSQTGRPEEPVTNIAARGTAQGLTVAGIGPEVIGDARLAVDATLLDGELAIDSARLESEVLTLTAEGTADVLTLDFEVDYELAAPRIAPLLDSLGLEGSGSVTASGVAVADDGALRLTTSAELADFTSDFASAQRVQLDGVVVSRERIEFDLTGFAEGLEVAGLDAEIIGRAELAVTGAIDGDTLTLDAASIDSDVLNAEVEGQMNTALGTGRFEYRVTVDELGRIADGYDVDLTGAASATGTVRLTEDGFALTTDAELTDLAGAVEADRLDLVATVDQTGERTEFRVDASSEQLTVELEGTELTGPVDAVVEGALEGDQLTLQTARIDSPVLTASAEGTVDLAELTGDLTYEVESARLAAIAPMLGVEASGLLSAEGSLEVAGTGEEAVPQIAGTAAVEDFSAMGYEIGDLAAVYDIALAEAPQGTLRLTLTDSPYAPDAPTVFALDMAGTPADWDVEFTLEAPNYLSAEGAATVAWEGPVSVEARVTAEPGEKLPEEYAQLLGDQAELVVDAQEGEDQTIRIDTARITSPVLNARAEGTYSLATGAADLEVELVAEPGLAAPFEGVEFAGLRFEGNVQGEPGSLTADGDLVLEGFASEQLAVESAVLEIDVGQTGTAEEPVTNIDAQGVIQGLRVAGIGPEAIGEARLSLDASLTGDKLTIDTARIDSGLLQLWAEGTVDVSTMDFDLDYNVAASNVGPLTEALLGLEAQGAVTAAGTVTAEGDALTLETRAELIDFASELADASRLTIQGTITQEDDRTAFDVTGSGEGLRIDGVAGDLLGDAEFAAEGVLDGNELTLETARISSPLLTATAEGTVNIETGAGQLAYDVDSVALGPIGRIYDLPVTGTASAEGVLGLAEQGAAEAPRIVGDATISDLTYAGTRIGDVRISHDAVLSEAPHGTLDAAVTSGPYAPAAIDTAFRLDGNRLILSGFDARGFGVTAAGDLTVNLETGAADGTVRLTATEGPFAPAEARARLRLEGDRLVLEDLRGQAMGLAAAGDLVVNLNTLTAEGTLRVDDAALTALGRMIGAPVTGDAQGTLRLTTERGRQVAVVDLFATGITAYDVTIGQARIEGTIVDLFGTPRVDLDIAAEHIVSGDLTLTTAVLTANGPISSLDIALRGTGGAGRQPVTIQAIATADLAGAATRLTVADLDLTIGQDRITLLAPLTVVSRGRALVVEDMAVALPDGGQLTGDIAYYGGPLVGDIVLDAPDLSFAARLFGAPIEAGALRVVGTFDTRPGNAGADLTVAGRNIVFSDIAGSNVLSLDGRLLWDGRIANIDLRVTGDFDQPLVLTASVPVVPTAGGFPRLAERGPVSARVNWEGEIGDIWALVPLPGHVVTGDARIDLGVSGDISSPIFTGGILLANGTYQNLDYGTIITGISVATEIESTGGLAMRLDGVDGAQGNVRLEGRIGFGPQGIDLIVETRRAIVVRRDDAVVRVDADMRIVQQPDGEILVAGNVVVLEAEVRLLLDNPPEIVTLGDVRIKGQPLVDDTGGFELPIRLAIDVVAPGRVFVRGRGLDSEWSIDLEVRGTAADPRITGEVAAIRGTLDLLGRDFDLERGRVIFDGGPSINPRLDVALVRETDDITGRIIISGTAYDPNLSFTSTPDLPEDEILPLLLFGTPAEALTPAQGVQLALGLATLLNGGGGTFDQFRAALGLDTLGIEQDEEGASVAIGKNITDDIWIGSRQSLEGEGTEVAIEIEVFENVEAYGEVSTDGDSAVGIQWKKDF